LTALLEMAEESRLRGDYRAGADLARRAALLAEASGDGVGRARALRSLAQQLLRLGQYGTAITACNDAVVQLDAIEDAAGVCETLTVQAMGLNELGLHDEALQALARARQIAQRLGDKILLYWVHNRSGAVHSSMGNHVNGNECYLRALSMADGMDTEARFCILNNLGENAIFWVPALRAEGDKEGAQQALTQALRYIDEALRLARSAAHPFREAICLDNFGMLLALSGDHAGALAMIEKSQAIAAAHGYRSQESEALQHQAQVRLMRGEPTEAIEGLLQALTRALEAGQKPKAMSVHRELTEAYQRVGDFAAALEHYKSFHQLERLAHNEVAATRARMMIHHFELDNVRLEADNARLEAELHRLRSVELEADKRSLQQQAHRLNRHAHEDALTGLANRRYIELRLPQMANLAAQAHRPMCVAIAAVDLFKNINDRFGHPLGDEVLRQIATVLRGSVREVDLAARLGGEEFLVAFDGIELASAYRMCDLVRTRVAEFPWDAIHPDLQVTISLGVVERSGTLDHLALLAHADKQLYKAKRNGRNRVEPG
jgi:diguanylate cyclase (GGDEF)-like protein